MTDTNHTDSVEVSYLTDIAIEVWNQNCDKSAPEAMRAVVTALQAHTSQQVEEAVRKEREKLNGAKIKIKSTTEIGSITLYDCPFQSTTESQDFGRTALLHLQALTPNHQD